MVLNVVYKSTAHVSIGDDIAFFGTKRLFDRVLPRHNAFLFSRKEKDCWKPESEMNVDLFVLAGTPVWSGKEMSGLENFIIENRKPVFYCGVGMNYGGNDKTDAALKNSIGFIARDNHAYKRAVQVTEARSFCCPSIFSVDPQPQTDDKIGIILQVDTWPEEQKDFVLRHDPKKTLIICNEIIDFIWAQKHIPQYEILYSRWLPDMTAFYLRCKAIYSMRIHGAHLAYALGIPTVCLKSEKDKSVVVKKIGLKMVRPNDVTPDDLSNDQSIKADMERKFMDYITLTMQNHYPNYVDSVSWTVSEEPSNGCPVEWSHEKWLAELEDGRKRFAAREMAQQGKNDI